MGRRLGIVVLIIVVLVLAWRSVFEVGQGHGALRTHFGRIDGADAGPGLHLKSPFDDVQRFDRRLVTRTFSGETFMTSDQKTLDVDFYLKWRIADPARYYQSTGGDEDAAAQRLSDLARDRIKTTVARESLAGASDSERGGLDTAAFARLAGAARQFGVELVDLQLQHIDLTDEDSNLAYQRMEQSFTARAQQTDAAGTLQADKIRADADRSSAEMLADATRQAQHVRAQADTRAAAIYAQAYGRNPEFAAFTRSLAAYKSSIGREGDILVITPESDFFKYLRSPSGH